MPAGSLGRGRQVWAQQRAIPSQAMEMYSHGSGTPVQQQHSVGAGMAAKHGSEYGQEHAPRPNSAVLKCPPMTERNTRRGMFARDGGGYTPYMFETLATFHLLMSALNVGLL
jgi:hypothetical protein